MKSERTFLLVVIGLKSLLVAAVLFLFGEERLIWADTLHYANLGTSMVKGMGFPTTEFMPLYPFLLGFFSLYIPHGYAALSLLQAIAAGFTALYVFRIGKIFLPARLALVAACVASFEPLITAMHILLMPETFFMLFTTAFLYYSIRFFREGERGFLYGSAAMLALAVYTKPAAMYLIVLTLPFFFLRKNGLRALVLFISILVLAFAPWLVRNNARVGSYVLNTNGARNVCSWGLSSIIAIKYGVDSSDWNQTIPLPEFQDTQARCRSSFGALRLFLTKYPKEFITMMSLSTASILTNEGYTVFFEKPAAEQIKMHHNYLTPAVFSNADWQLKIRSALGEFSAAELALIFAMKLFWLLLAICAVVGAGRGMRDKSTRGEAVFLSVVVCYFLFASAAAGGLAAGARYRYQIAGLLLIFACGSTHQICRRIASKLPITRIKIGIARVLYRLVHAVARSDIRTIQRRGIMYEVDLSEGMELSLFLFGGFQKHIYQNAFLSFRGDEIIFDVGANAGLMALPFAKLVPQGRVYAFEPTQYAFGKLKRNMSLNPAIAERITPIQTFVSSHARTSPDIIAYASWKVDGSLETGRHPVHQGTSKNADGISSITLDGFVTEENVTRLDLIKIDTDGHEWDVLQGARDIIPRFRPRIIFEIGMYVMKERGIAFSDYESFFSKFHYDLYNSGNGMRVTTANHTQHIPLYGTIDIIAVPHA